MSDIKYAVVSMSTIVSDEECKRQFSELLSTQWVEVDHRRKTSSLDVDFNKYIEMEKLGMHYIVIAYLNDLLVGYCSMFSAPSPHTGEVTATTDSMFVRKEYRKNNVGRGLIKLAEKEAVSKGAKHIMVTFKNNAPHSNIVEDLGFFSYETIYAKAIGG